MKNMEKSISRKDHCQLCICFLFPCNLSYFSLSHAHAAYCCSWCNTPWNNAYSSVTACADGNLPPNCTCDLRAATLHFETLFCSMVGCNVHSNLTPPTTEFLTAILLANKTTENMISLTSRSVLWMHIINIAIIHSIHIPSFVSI